MTDKRERLIRNLMNIVRQLDGRKLRLVYVFALHLFR